MELKGLVCMGDSLTEGWGIQPNMRWSNLLSEDLNLRIINSGISGDSTAGMLSRFQHMVIDHNPSHVIIMGGTNDLNHHLPITNILSNIIAMTRQARHHSIESIIGLPTRFHMLQSEEYTGFYASFENLARGINQLRSALKAMAIEDEWPWIDFDQNLTTSMFLEDGLHPNEEGHKIMKENAKILLQKIGSLV